MVLIGHLLTIYTIAMTAESENFPGTPHPSPHFEESEPNLSC